MAPAGLVLVLCEGTLGVVCDAGGTGVLAAGGFVAVVGVVVIVVVGDIGC